MRHPYANAEAPGKSRKARRSLTCGNILPDQFSHQHGMKRILAIVVSLALTALMAGELPVGHIPAESCPAVRTGCCSDTPASPDHVPPAGSACLRYCTACCAVVVSPAIELPAPASIVAPWSARSFAGNVRRDP